MTQLDHASRSSEPKFWLGQFSVTEQASQVLDLEDVLICLKRHHTGDWGDLCDEDKQANEGALIHGDRILSHYKLGDGKRIYIITEADRSSTCVLLPEEY